MCSGIPFQFHKVQLKGYGIEDCRMSISFQFHKVQLKAPVSDDTVYEMTFQFHKVQLKGSDTKKQRGKTSVSIP